MLLHQPCASLWNLNVPVCEGKLHRFSFVWLWAFLLEWQRALPGSSAELRYHTEKASLDEAERTA